MRSAGLHQRPAAVQVAVAVVDPLEPVEVHEEQRQRAAAPKRPLHLPPQRAGEEAGVVQARQLVDRRQRGRALQADRGVEGPSDGGGQRDERRQTPFVRLCLGRGLLARRVEADQRGDHAPVALHRDRDGVRASRRRARCARPARRPPSPPLAVPAARRSRPATAARRPAAPRGRPSASPPIRSCARRTTFSAIRSGTRVELTASSTAWSTSARRPARERLRTNAASLDAMPAAGRDEADGRLAARDAPRVVRLRAFLAAPRRSRHRVRDRAADSPVAGCTARVPPPWRPRVGRTGEPAG